VRRPPALFLTVTLALSLLAAPAHAGLFLSELCDPQLNYTTDRFIEIFNSGPDAVDLTGWSVVAIANTVDVTTWTLSGTLPAGQARVCGGTTTVTGFTVNFASALWTSSGYYNWNGKVGDGAKLVNPSSVIVDHVLVADVLFENSDMVRNASVTEPNATFTISEWTITPVALATDASPGTHNGSTLIAGPTISNIVTVPLTPEADLAVDVHADVVDTSGAIASVTLSWGTVSTSLTNSIAMALIADSTYGTSSQIPGQPGGATVYYRIAAVGAVATTTTSVLSYTLPGGGAGAPTILAVGEMSDSTLLVQFSEPVEETSAETPGNYAVGALSAVAAARDDAVTANVLITVRGLTAGTRTVTVNGVADLEANVAYGVTCDFPYVDVTIPAGYYDSAIGLKGWALRLALHDIIDDHTVKSYDYALIAFATTDIKYNGRIWDVYSDVPGGIPPYEYDYGETGQGATEGLGYNREHVMPQSWFNGVSPPYSDEFNLYPTDSYVNNKRANYPYGEVGTATWTSLNGSRLGSSVSDGYTGTVFEPIDPYKGDLVRSHFYMSTRYYGEDGSWASSGATDGAELLPWAAAQYLAWSDADPVSWKERMRNGAVYAIQGNRNPFVDHPEFVTAVYDSNSVVGVEDAPLAATVRLQPNRPNPFSARTSIRFDLPRRERVALRVYDVTGRAVRTLADGEFAAGSHALDWDGRGEGGAPLQAGLYFCRLEAGAAQATRRMVLAR
jgi:endonuclease I